MFPRPTAPRPPDPQRDTPAMAGVIPEHLDEDQDFGRRRTAPARPPASPRADLNPMESTASGGETPTGSAVPGVVRDGPRSREAPQGLRTKIAKMGKVGRHSLDRDPDEFSEKPGVFCNLAV